MIQRKNLGGVTWLDLESPTENEVRAVSEEIGIDESEAEELISPSFKHKIDFRTNHAYLVLHFPSFKEGRDGDAAYEVDFILTKDKVVTAHYGEISALEDFDPKSESEQDLFLEILGELIGDFEYKLSSVDHWVRDIEKKMFKGEEKEAVFTLSEASRHLTDFKKITSVYSDSFQELEAGGQKMFGPKFKKSLSLLKDRSEKISAKLSVLLEWTSDLRETNSSLLNINQNETMKALTMMALFTFPLSLIASIFNLQTSYRPFQGNPNDFFLILGIMLLVAIVMFIYFKYKKWL